MVDGSGKGFRHLKQVSEVRILPLVYGENWLKGENTSYVSNKFQMEIIIHYKLQYG